MEDLLLWAEETERKIEELEFKFVDQISVRKSCSQSGFQKRKYPPFSGKILDYYEFKQRWIEEVAPEKKPEVHELNALKEQLPDLGKNKLRSKS